MTHTKSTTDAKAPVSPSTRLDDIGLPTRAVNCLRREGITCIGDLAQRTEDWILRTPGLGHKSLEDIGRVLERAGLRFSGQAGETE
jgi:DNA-directed RNA polymerase subunit alpha